MFIRSCAAAPRQFPTRCPSTIGPNEIPTPLARSSNGARSAATSGDAPPTAYRRQCVPARQSDRSPLHHVRFDAGAAQELRRADGGVEERSRTRASLRQKLGDLKLLIVGSPGWRCESILKEMRGLTARGELFHLGRVSTEELRILYSHAGTSMVFPSHAEGFGYPPLEAMRPAARRSSRPTFPSIAGCWAMRPRIVTVMTSRRLPRRSNGSWLPTTPKPCGRSWWPVGSNAFSDSRSITAASNGWTCCIT